MKAHIRSFRDVVSLCQRAAAHFALAAGEAVRAKGFFTVALSGGSTPKAMYSLLASDPVYREEIAWDRCFFFWSDERQVPPDHADSNFRMVKESLLGRFPLRPDQVFRMSGELRDASETADEYERILSAFFKLKPGELPRFDLALLGLGPDGHTASLFPDTPALHVRDRLVTANWVGKLATHRTTLTLPVLNNAAHAMFLVGGEDKATALARVLEGPLAPMRLPAQLIRPTRGSLLWLVDDAAASGLKSIPVQEDEHVQYSSDRGIPGRSD